ncbi:hypothetical protein V8E55_009089 [Tylopilus felleus]
MDTYKILVGSYTNSIYTLEFDPALSGGGTPTLKLISQVDVGHHPSWIDAHPSDRSLIFTRLGRSDRRGQVDEATCPSGGADPCTLLVTEHELIYSGGTVASIPISASPPYTRPGELWTLALPLRMENQASHPHQTVFNLLNTTENELLVPDLGSDKVGGGPRHVATHGNALCILLELTSELAPLTHFDNVAAEILIPKPNRSFPTAYIYGDTIAIFSLEKGEEYPELATEVRTGLRHVRGMVFGGEDDKWLVVGGAGSADKSLGGGGVKIYERVDGGKGLRQIAELDSAVGGKLNATSFLWF